MLSRRFFTIFAVGFGVVLAAMPARAQLRDFTGYDANTLAPSDDKDVLVDLGFTINFFGKSYSQFYINTNGNISFDLPNGVFNPTAINGSTPAIIAPFYADVDTTSTGQPITYGAGKLGGYDAFAVNWLDVSFFGSAVDALNSFQLVIIDRSTDFGVGAFDFEFNYQQILWEAGLVSSGNSLGLGGNTARAGYSNGSGAFFEFPGSGVPGAFLDFTVAGDGLSLTNDPNPTALTSGQMGAAFDGPAVGRYSFSVRNSVPDTGSTLVMAVLGIGALMSFRRRRA